MRREKGKQSGVEVLGAEEEKQRIPNWFGEAVLLGKYWQESGLVARLEEEVRVERGRMGQYEVSDFVLLLNSYAISGEKTLKAFFEALMPVKEVLMSLWGRSRAPVASSLSRFLAVVSESAVEALRQMFEWDLDRNGLRVMQGIGLFDRSKAHAVVFDVDGTVCAARQRWLAEDRENYPMAKRRSGISCAPGYRGRKRGEVIRTRTTVAQAQTSEWLGTYGGAGNGNPKGDLERACEGIQRYLEQQGLNECAWASPAGWIIWKCLNGEHSATLWVGLYLAVSGLSVIEERRITNANASDTAVASNGRQPI